jgi:hypothetical protein
MGIHSVRLPSSLPSCILTYSPHERKISPQEPGGDPKTDYDYIIPVVNLTSLDLRCGRNASIAWSKPKTAVIRAGDNVGFAVNTSVGLPIVGAPVMPWDASILVSFGRHPNLTSVAALAKLVPSRSGNSMAFSSSWFPGRLYRRW